MADEASEIPSIYVRAGPFNLSSAISFLFTQLASIVDDYVEDRISELSICVGTVSAFNVYNFYSLE